MLQFLHGFVNILRLVFLFLPQAIMDWALSLVNNSHAKSIQDLTMAKNGWHFLALCTSVEQLHDFHLDKMVWAVLSCQRQGFLAVAAQSSMKEGIGFCDFPILLHRWGYKFLILWDLSLQ